MGKQWGLATSNILNKCIKIRNFINISMFFKVLMVTTSLHAMVGTIIFYFSKYEINWALGVLVKQQVWSTITSNEGFFLKMFF